MNNACIAIDVGGTKISAALIRQNKIIDRVKAPSVIHSDLTNLSSYLYSLCEKWVPQASQLAVACTGQVGARTVGFMSANKVLPLQQQLTDKFNLPLTIINDAAAAAWAEFCHLKTSGAFAHKAENLTYITVSTGVGGGIVQNGQLVSCDDGFCAHLGHVSVPLSGLLVECHCGRFNCVEAIASGTAIAARASKQLSKPVTCEQVFTSFLANSDIGNIVDQACEAVVELIGNVKASTGSELVVLGGSVGKSNAFFSQVQRLLCYLPERYQPNLMHPHYGADADLWGAYWFSQQHEKGQ